MLAILRIRGAPKMSTDIERTLFQLSLTSRHACAILADTPSLRGMIKMVASHVAWGEVSETVIKQIEGSARRIAKHAFGLKSPKKGMARKGVKLPHTMGGDLGHRKDIDKLLQRMI